MTRYGSAQRQKLLRDLEILERARAALADNPGITPRELARRTSTSPTYLRPVLGPGLTCFVRKEPHMATRERKRARSWTDRQLLEALREASVRLNGNVREAHYSVLASQPGSRAPSSQTLIRRFGTWNAALSAANVLPVKPMRAYEKWTAGRCAEVVAQFVLEVRSSSSSKYDDWATGHDDRPSKDTIEKVLAWHEVVNRALPLFLERGRRAGYAQAVFNEADARRAQILASTTLRDGNAST